MAKNLTLYEPGEHKVGINLSNLQVSNYPGYSIKEIGDEAVYETQFGTETLRDTTYVNDEPVIVADGQQFGVVVPEELYEKLGIAPKENENHKTL